MLPLLEGRPEFWVEHFGIRRHFDVATENQTYLEFVRWLHHDDDCGDEEDDEEDQEEDDEGEAAKANNEGGGAEEEDDEVLSDGNDSDFSEDEGEPVAEDRLPNINASKEDVARLVMREEEGLPLYHDQAERIERLCGHVTPADLEKQLLGAGRKCVGIIHDISKSNRRRPRGKLHAAKFYRALRIQRFGNDQADDDLEKRLIYAPHPDRYVILALLASATRTQITALRAFVYNYLISQTSIGITIPTVGFKTFAFSFHARYFALRRHARIRVDARQYFADNTPMRRKADRLGFLDKFDEESSAGKKIPWLYEGHISILVMGIDDFRYEALAFVDGCFDKDSVSVRRFQKLNNPNGHADPILKGRSLVDCAAAHQSPRSYFLKAVEIWTDFIEKEYQQIVESLKETLQKHRRADNLPSRSSENEASERLRLPVREYSTWISEMIQFLRQQNVAIVELIRNDKELKAKIFQSPDGSLVASIGALGKTCSELEAFSTTLEGMIKELNEGRQALDAHLAIENNVAAMSQHKTAEFVKILTVITLLISPIGLGSSMVGTQVFTQDMTTLVISCAVSLVLVLLALSLYCAWPYWPFLYRFLLTVIYRETAQGLEHEKHDAKSKSSRSPGRPSNRGNKPPIGKPSLPKKRGSRFRLGRRARMDSKTPDVEMAIQQKLDGLYSGYGE